METFDIPMTQESSHVEIINKASTHHLLWYEGYYSLWIHFTRPVNQAYYVEILKQLMWSCV
jgi:hypothetical protein